MAEKQTPGGELFGLVEYDQGASFISDAIDELPLEREPHNRHCPYATAESSAAEDWRKERWTKIESTAAETKQGPERIWMAADTPFDLLDTWGKKINDSDIEYIRKDLTASVSPEQLRAVAIEIVKDVIRIEPHRAPTYIDTIVAILERRLVGGSVTDHCWHCGVALSPAARPRCEDCPDECDLEGCNAFGCVSTGPAGEGEG